MTAATPATPELSSTLRWLSQALTLLILVAIAWLVARWVWSLAAPPATSSAPQQTATTSDDWARARDIFGDAGAEPAGTTSTSGIRLRGVYAVDGKTLSAAVVNTGGKRDVAVRIGEEIEKGVTLAAVEADYIEISRGGARERIDLDRRIVAARPGARGTTQAARAFRLNVASTGPNSVSISRSELNTTLQDPNQLAYTGRIGTSPQGGVRMDSAPPGSLPHKLGLLEGDVIKSLNGQPVGSPGDLARLYGQFGTLNSLRAEVQRGGQTVVMNLQITP